MENTHAHHASFIDLGLPTSAGPISCFAKKVRFHVLAISYQWMVTYFKVGIEYIDVYDIMSKHYKTKYKDQWEEVYARVRDQFARYRLEIQREFEINDGWGQANHTHVITLGFMMSIHKQWLGYLRALEIKDTLHNKTFTFSEWYNCRDLKTEFAKRFPIVGGVNTFELASDMDLDVARIIDGKYNSEDWKEMIRPSSGFNFKLKVHRI